MRQPDFRSKGGGLSEGPQTQVTPSSQPILPGLKGYAFSEMPVAGGRPSSESRILPHRKTGGILNLNDDSSCSGLWLFV